MKEKADMNNKEETEDLELEEREMKMEEKGKSCRMIYS